MRSTRRSAERGQPISVGLASAGLLFIALAFVTLGVIFLDIDYSFGLIAIAVGVVLFLISMVGLTANELADHRRHLREVAH